MLEQGALDAACEALWRDGVCMVPGAVDRQLLGECLAALESNHPHLFLSDDAEHKLFVSRGRFYSAMEIAGVFARADALLPPDLEKILRGSLGPDFVFDSWGIINALPGAEEQHWHRDGGILFPSHPLEFMLPATAITLAIPLVEMNDETGTTGFSLRSHRAPEHAVKPDYEPRVPVGSALLWDYRVFHKGMANRSGRARPLLYATVCRNWWSDTGNHEDQDRLIADRAAYLAMDESLRARLGRAKIVG